MNRRAEIDEIKPLIINYIFHFVLYALILTMHLVIYYRIYWIYNSLNILFLIFTYCNVIYFIFPIIPLTFLLMKKYKKKIMNVLKLITFILLIISLLFGLITSIVLLINTINSKLFCKECPFSLSIDHLNALFNTYYDKRSLDGDTKNLCYKRRCILDQENIDEKFPFVYLCNYNPLEEFSDNNIYKRKFPNGTEIESNRQLKCFSITSTSNVYNFKHSELQSYINLCFFYTDFYKCERFNEPEKKYNLDLKENCPDTNYLTILHIIIVLVFIVDLFIPLIPWRIEYLSYKNILNILSIIRIEVNSVNSTAKSSRISENDNSFKKEKTPVLIFPLEERINSENIITSQNLIASTNNKNENDNDVNNITTSFKEDEKIVTNKKPINFKQIQNSDRYKLNMRNLEIDIGDNDNYYNNRIYLGKIKKRNHYENTTVISYQTQKKENKENIDNKIDEDEK